MFYGMFTPSSRIKSKAEIEIRKLIIKKFNSEWHVYINFFQTEIIWHSPAVLEEMAFVIGSTLSLPSFCILSCRTSVLKFEGGKQRAIGC